MGKRKVDLDEESPHRKRKRLTKEQAPKPEVPNIESSKDLQLLLRFEQDAGPQTRQKIQSFKLFLESIAYGKESDDRTAQQGLLLGYLQSQAPREGDETSAYLADLTQTWHFAAQSDVEGLFSSVAAVLALLLKTISSFIEFRACGNNLCRSLLQDNQVKLFDRAFSANKVKEHLISPCLRLLTEIVLFDGGQSARSLFRQREITFKRLEIFLSVRKNARDGDLENNKKPSIRNNALRYLYANLRLQNSAAKMSILARGKVVRAMFEGILEDAPNVVLEMLDVLKTDIASDSAITHSAKGGVFSTWTLGRLATLYSYPETENLPQDHQSIQRSAHEFLLLLCTTPGRGVIDSQQGIRANVEGGEAGLTKGHKRRSSTVNILHNGKQRYGRNERLASFLQSLRPYASILQSDLIIAVFRILPDMISDYFTRRHSFSFDPKATATWIGYSSFLLATVQLPLTESLIPRNSGGVPSSQYATIIESILPQPLTQKVMTRCLNQSANLIKFLATRILTSAFEKVAKVLQICDEVRSHLKSGHSSWDRMTSKLTAEFCERIPEMEHVIAQFRHCPKENDVLRESITRLLALYYKVIPQIALEEKFDISVAMSAALKDEELTEQSLENDGVRLLEIDHLLAIAHQSPNMQWFHKSGAMRLSPFTRLLQLYLDRRRDNSEFQNLGIVLKSVARESQILHSQNSLDIIVVSLQGFNEWRAANRVFEFIDDCILRLVRKPIRYYDDLTDLVLAANIGMNASDSNIDLLLIALLEQWPFLVKIVDPPALANVSTWLVHYIEMMWITVGRKNSVVSDGGDNKIISLIRDQMKAEINDRECKMMFSKALKDPSEFRVPDEPKLPARASEEKHITKSISDDEDVGSKSSTDLMPSGPPRESEDHPGLNSWSREDVSDAISGGSIADLILCLCSGHAEIRKQGLGNLRTFMGKLESSRYSEWQQVFMLAGELVETAKNVIDESPLPYFAGVLAVHLLSIIANPLHLMYGKVNKFLNRGPSWTVTKLPSYWVDKILLNPPTEDDAHYLEIEWLLNALIDGLRTPTDFDIYRRCNIFERLLSFSASPSSPRVCSQKIVDLLFRCTYVDGSTTLITRCGLLSWLSTCLTTQKTSDVMGDGLRSLSTRVYETSDQDRVNEWSDRTLKFVVDRLSIPITE